MDIIHITIKKNREAIFTRRGPAIVTAKKNFQNRCLLMPKKISIILVAHWIPKLILNLIISLIIIQNIPKEIIILVVITEIHREDIRITTEIIMVIISKEIIRILIIKSSKYLIVLINIILIIFLFNFK